MSQFDWPTLQNSNSGAQLVIFLNAIIDAIETGNSGSAEPSYKQAGLTWRDTSSSPWAMKLYDGQDWITLFHVDPSSNIPVFPQDPDLTSALGDITTLEGQIGKWFKAIEAIKTGASYSVVAGDAGTPLVGNRASTITFNLAAAATLGSGWVAPFFNIGAGDMVLDADSSEEINGATTLTLKQYEGAIVWCNGSTFRAFRSRPASPALLNVLAQVVSGGFRVTSNNLGTKSSSSYKPDPGNGPLQYLTNGGAFTLQAPDYDGSFAIEVTNNGSAGTITFSGFASGHPKGDALTTTNGHTFLVTITRVNGKSYCSILAGQ